MGILIRVRRKCDGETGVIKGARGSNNGLQWVTVIFDRLPTARNVNISHFDIVSIDTGLHSVQGDTNE